MSSFRKVVNITGLNADSQNVPGFIHGLLSLGDSTNSGEDVETNAVREVVRRLAAAGVNAHVLGVVKGYLNTIETRLDGGA